MSHSATVNYHVHSPERQAFHIDAGGVTGAVLAPELVPTQIALRDLRGREADLRFETDGIAFANHPSLVTSFDATNSWQAPYSAEITSFLTQEIMAKEVIVFDHTLRVDDPNSDRKPARNVHSDYSALGAQNRLVDILGAERAADWSAGHYAFINLWRPVGNPINSAPLGFVRPSSVAQQDWIPIDLIYPDRRGHIMGLAANEAHDWLYQSRMTPDELVFFNIYDNQGLASVGHSAIDRVEDPNINTIRQSLESRTLVRF